MSEKTDIAIIGAGMVGLSLAHLLAPAIKQGLSISLIERQPISGKDSHIPSFDGRATAISYGSQQVLEQLGVWQQLSEPCAIEHISVTEQGRVGSTHMHAHEVGSPALGYIVENAKLGQALLHNVPEHTRFAPAEVTRIQATAKGMLLTFADNRELLAQLVVLADGNRSGLAAQLGISHRQQSYGQQAIVTQVKSDRAHQNWAYERFTQAGPVAFLPLKQQNFAVVLSVDNAQVDALLRLPDEDFLAILQDKIGSRLGNLVSLGQRHHYPLSLSLADEQVRQGLVLLGNAAHSLHPVAGQGFNLALRDTVHLSNKLKQAYAQGLPLGDLSLLLHYQREQMLDQHSVTYASDFLPKLFTHKNPLLAHGRNLGLLALNLMPRTRKCFTQYAMGQAQINGRIN